MGTLRSVTDHSGATVRRITLGIPSRQVDPDGQPIGPYLWSDAALPDGEIDADGSITIDEVERG